MKHSMLYRPKNIPGNLWPFRICGDGVEWYTLRSMEWIKPVGVKDTNGYHMMNWKLPDGSRRFLRLHNIVWIAFNGEVPEGLEIDHIDGDKSNNSIRNLRLVTHGENITYARERLGNWSGEALTKLLPHQMDLLLALPTTWRCLKPLAERWGMSKFSLGNVRALAKKQNDPRYLGGL